MQPSKGRASPKDSPQKPSLRPARELKLNPVERSFSSPSSKVTPRTPKDKSPKVTDRRLSRSPISEKKRPSKLSELETQISKLQNDLSTVKEQLVVSESSRTEAEADAEDVKRKLDEVSLKLQDSQKQLSELDASKHAVVDQHDISQEEQEWESKIEAARQQQLTDAASLKSALDEIQKLKEQLEDVSVLKDVQEKESDSTQFELQSLKNNLAETSCLVESMRCELEQTKNSEAEAQNMVKQTLLQLEGAKDTINALRTDIANSKEANDSVANELQQSRAHVSFLESFVDNLKKINNEHKSSESESTNEGIIDVDELQTQLQATQSEVRQLRSALEASEIRFNEERSCSKKQIEDANEIVSQIKAQSSIREAELAEELKKASADIFELKASLMDKETELQGISEENENLTTKLGKKSELCHRDQEMEAELAKLREDVAVMKAMLMDKETELQNVFSENDTLKVEINKWKMDTGVEAAEVEAARAAEAEALTKLGFMMEEVDKSNRKVARVTEQLEAAQSVSADMEAELRRLKVQSDQWRKAAEAAASMLSPGGNGKYVERSGSMPLGGKYSPVNSPYLDDYDDDSFKKKNGNVLKKIGVLWKKPQK